MRRTPSAQCHTRRIYHLPPKICTKRCQFSHRDCQNAHAKQIKPAGATAKLPQNSALSARREKRHLHPLLQLRFSTMRTWKQSFRMNLASRQPRGHRNCNFRGKSRRLKLEKMHMNVHIFNRFHLY